jgi:hypothetical protein
MSTSNPHAPPYASVVSRAAANAEAARLEHLAHESSVRSIGTLYYIGGFWMLLAGGSLVYDAITLPAASADFSARDIGIGFLVLSLVSFVVGWGVRRLKRWAGGAAVVLSAITALAVPVGTVIGGYLLYVLLAAKGRRVLASDYASIVAATPHLKCRTSIAVWIALGVVALLTAVLVAASRLVG